VACSILDETVEAIKLPDVGKNSLDGRSGQHRLRVFENRVLRRIFGPMRDEVTGGWRNCIRRSFMICTLRQV
jgi:hypothetical protein